MNTYKINFEFSDENSTDKPETPDDNEKPDDDFDEE